LFLDSTYALAKSSFADQAEVVDRIAAELADTPASTLVLVGAYNVGKERVIFKLADRLDCHIYTASGRKKSIYAVLDLSDSEKARFTDDPAKAQIHIVPLGFCGEMWPFFQPNFSKCEEYLASLPFYAMVGVMPTGHADASNWNRKHEVVTKGRVTLRLYAYSEHSSAKELEEFVRLVRPVNLVPTVFRDKKEQTAIVRRFHHLLDQAGAARQLFSLAASSATAKQEAPKEFWLHPTVATVVEVAGDEPAPDETASPATDVVPAHSASTSGIAKPKRCFEAPLRSGMTVDLDAEIDSDADAVAAVKRSRSEKSPLVATDQFDEVELIESSGAED